MDSQPRRSPTIFSTEHHLQWGRVVYVYDGEQVLVEMGLTAQKVKIARLQGPDKGHSKYMASKKFIKDAVLGRWIGLENHRQQWDTLGRRIASVWYGEGFKKNLAEEMAKADLGMVVSDNQPVPMRSYHPRGALTLDPSEDLK